MLSGAGNAAIVVVLEDKLEPCRHPCWEPQDSSPAGWKRLCFWEERELLGGRCFLPHREQSCCPTSSEGSRCVPPEYCVLSALQGLCAQAVFLTVPGRWQVHLRVMQQFVLGKKVWGFFWERSCRVCVTGKREVNYVFFDTLNSIITPAGCFVTQLTATLESAAKWITLFKLFPVKYK